MTEQSFNFFFPKGQSSIEAVDMHVVATNLSGEQKIERFLGGSGTHGAFRSLAHLMSDDSVFLVKHWPQPDGVEVPGIDEAHVAKSRVVRELGEYGACEVMLDGQRALEHRVLSGE